MEPFVIPRNKFLLNQVDKIEQKIIEWYKQNHYSQGSAYSVRITSKGKWAVRHDNDYPLQHGEGKERILTEDDFQAAMNIKQPS